MARERHWADEARTHPLRVVELLRARERPGGDPPPAAWLGALSALEHAFAPDELTHLTLSADERGIRPTVSTTHPSLRERLEQTGERAGFTVDGMR